MKRLQPIQYYESNNSNGGLFHRCNDTTQQGESSKSLKSQRTAVEESEDKQMKRVETMYTEDEWMKHFEHHSRRIIKKYIARKFQYYFKLFCIGALTGTVLFIAWLVCELVFRV